MIKGKFIVVDGLDGVGKDVFLNTFVSEAKKERKRVFNVHEFWKENGFHPKPEDIIGNFDIVLTSEPTFVGVGKLVREELVAKNGRDYHHSVVAGAYALDRMILYQTLILPLLEAGIDIYQSRSFSTSIVYQRQTAKNKGERFSVNQIMSIPGNAFCAQNPMTHLVVPTIGDVNEVMKRLSGREKDDNCVFENLPFQLKVKEHYESLDFQKFFASLGVPVTYLDAGKTIEFSKEQAKEFYHKYLA